MDYENTEQQEEMPRVARGDRVTNASGSTRYVYVVRRHIHTALIWTVYVFQCLMALIVLYRAIVYDAIYIIEYWSIVIGYLLSVIAIAWAEENLIFKDGLDD